MIFQVPVLEFYSKYNTGLAGPSGADKLIGVPFFAKATKCKEGPPQAK